MALSQTEVAMIQEAMTLVQTGLTKLSALDSSHPALIAAIAMMQTALSFGEKAITVFEVV